MIVKKILLLLIQAYRYGISPYVGPACRFYPSCSEYAYEAVNRYGVGMGMWLAVKRVLRCHPFHPGGVDPVPTGPVKHKG